MDSRRITSICNPQVDEDHQLESWVSPMSHTYPGRECLSPGYPLLVWDDQTSEFLIHHTDVDLQGPMAISLHVPPLNRRFTSGGSHPPVTHSKKSSYLKLNIRTHIFPQMVNQLFHLGILQSGYGTRKALPAPPPVFWPKLFRVPATSS